MADGCCGGDAQCRDCPLVYNDLGKNCRSGCATKDHRTFGECARSAHISTQWLGGAASHSYSDEKAFAREVEYFNQAANDGLDPAGVSRAAVDAAYRDAERV